MAKRDRDTGIWKEKFYRTLPPLYKCFWDFINDECDNAGVWVADFPGAKLYIGKRIDPDKAIELFGDRVQIFDSGNKWHIKTFVFEKLGFTELNPAHKFQKSIIDLLHKHKIEKNKGYPDTLQSVKEREGQENGKDGIELNKKESVKIFDSALSKIAETLSDVEDWTDQVIQGNDEVFTNMSRELNVNGGLEKLAKDHLALCARYNWHEKMTTQQAFRYSLVNHLAESLSKQKVSKTAPETIEERKQKFRAK